MRFDFWRDLFDRCFVVAFLPDEVVAASQLNCSLGAKNSQAVMLMAIGEIGGEQGRVRSVVPSDVDDIRCFPVIQLHVIGAAVGDCGLRSIISGYKMSNIHDVNAHIGNKAAGVIPEEPPEEPPDTDEYARIDCQFYWFRSAPIYADDSKEIVLPMGYEAKLTGNEVKEWDTGITWIEVMLDRCGDYVGWISKNNKYISIISR